MCLPLFVNVFLRASSLLVFLLADSQAGHGQRNQAKELGKMRADVHGQQHRTVMMNGTYDVQVSTSQQIQMYMSRAGCGPAMHQ